MRNNNQEKSRPMTRIANLILTALLLAPLTALHAAPPQRPNIVFILADDIG